VVTLDSAIAGLKKSLPERLHNTLPANEEALRTGMELIQKVE
jgi:2-oxoglutarate ferredoxin oxidoreductase subunit gamma